MELKLASNNGLVILGLFSVIGMYDQWSYTYEAHNIKINSEIIYLLRLSSHLNANDRTQILNFQIFKFWLRAFSSHSNKSH